MQKLLTKYGLAAHLAFLAVAPLFLSPNSILILSALCSVWIVMEPSRIGSEMLHNARLRVFRKIFRDPVFWVMVAVAAFAGVRAANGGVGLAYDAENLNWFVSLPSLPMLPGSANGAGLNEFAAAVAILVVVSGVRLALGRAARGAFLLLSSAFAGIGSTVMFLQLLENAEFAQLAAKCDMSTPSFIGSAFGVYLSFAICALSAAQENGWYMSIPLAMFALGANAIGLFLFAPPAMAALYAISAIVVFLYSFAYARFRIGPTAEFKFLVFFSMPIVLSLVFVSQSVDSSVINVKIAPYLEGGSFKPEGFDEARELLSSVAAKVWKNNPWLGSGLGSFGFNLKFHVQAADWMIIPPVQSAPLNGYWLLLAERGIIGAFLIVSVLGLLVVFYLMRLVKSIGTHLAQPATVMGVAVVAGAVFETFAATTFLTPGMLIALASALAISAVSFPKEKKNHG